MNKPPELTSAQYEILLAIESAGRPVTVSELWARLNGPHARTTILTWVQRLEKRGWVERTETDEGIAYSVARSPEDGAVNAAENLVDSLFRGSPSRLVMALAGRGRIDAAEAQRLRKLLDEMEARDV